VAQPVYFFMYGAKELARRLSCRQGRQQNGIIVRGRDERRYECNIAMGHGQHTVPGYEPQEVLRAL
jgi:hypothetical protein